MERRDVDRWIDGEKKKKETDREIVNSKGV
jgi:hypothetical protein